MRLSTTALAPRIGVSYRQLDYWCRKRWVFPENDGRGSGSARWWPPTQIRRAMVLARISELGFLPRGGRGIDVAAGLALLSTVPDDVAADLVLNPDRAFVVRCPVSTHFDAEIKIHVPSLKEVTEWVSSTI